MTKSTERPTSSSSEIKTTAELRQMAREGDRFAKRVGKQLAGYSGKAAVRMEAAAARHATIETALQGGTETEGPDPLVLRRIGLDSLLPQKTELDLGIATLEFMATRLAAEIILQQEATV